jgi:hypothetical protein
MDARTHTHLGSRTSRRRLGGLVTFAAMAGLLELTGASAAMAAAPGGSSSASQVVRAGAKAIGHASKPNASGHEQQSPP